MCMNDDKYHKFEKSERTELILGVQKPIWLATTGPMEEPDTKIIGWTTTKPKYDNGFIDTGTILVFSHIYNIEDKEEGLNFITIRPGPEYDYFTPEFFQKEIDSLTKEGVFTLFRLEDINEISIFQENLFIKYPKYLSFDARVLSSKDIYIIMGSEESKLSDNRIYIGEKISLKRLIEIYSAAVGQNLVLK